MDGLCCALCSFFPKRGNFASCVCTSTLMRVALSPPFNFSATYINFPKIDMAGNTAAYACRTCRTTVPLRLRICRGARPRPARSSPQSSGTTRSLRYTWLSFEAEYTLYLHIKLKDILGQTATWVRGFVNNFLSVPRVSLGSREAAVKLLSSQKTFYKTSHSSCGPS